MGTGLCNCIEDFAGGNCDTFAEGMSMYSTTVNSDVLSLRAENPVFKAAVLRLHSNTPGNNRFYFMTVESPATIMWKLTGGGDLEMNYGGVRVGKKSPLVVASSGVGIVGGVWLRGGVKVQSRGLYSSQLITIEEGLYVDRDGIEVGGRVEISGGLYSSDAFVVNSRGLLAHDGVAVSAGGATISLGGMRVVGGMSVNSGGLTLLKRGMTIQNMGLRIISGGLSLTGAAAGMGGLIGLTIPSGGLVGEGGLTVFNLGLYSTPEGLTIGGGGMRVSTGLTVNSGGMVVTGGFTFSVGNMIVNDAVNVYSGGFHSTAGITVASNGVIIRADGLVVTDGITAVDNGMAAAGGMTISDIGFNTPFMTVTPRGLQSNGVVVVQDGFVVSSGGITVTGVTTLVDNSGVTIQNGGLIVNGGLSVNDVGVALSGPVSISSLGLPVVSGSMSISTGGLSAADGIRAVTNGFTSEKGLSVSSAGARVTGIATVDTRGLVVSASGLSISGTGAKVTAGGLTVNNGGFAITEGMSVVSNGLLIGTSGLSVRTSGMHVASGITIATANLVAHSMFVTDGLRSQTQFIARQGGLVFVDGALSVAGNGLAMTNGLSIGSVGLIVSAGSMTSLGPYYIDGAVSSNAALVFDALNIKTGGFYSSLGMTVTSGGANLAQMSVIGGVSIGGTVNVLSKGVVSGAVTRVFSSGLMIDDSITVKDDGIRVTGGLSIEMNGMNIDIGGLNVTAGGFTGVLATVNSNGLRVSGASSITSLGASAARVTVASNGAAVSGGILVNNRGLIASGTTIRSRGLRINAGDMTSKNVAVGGGINIQNTGLNLQGGVTVAQGIFVRSGGFRLRGNGFRLKGLGQLRVDDGGLIFNGNCTVFGDTRLQNAPEMISDERLKYDLETLQDPLYKVGKLRGVYYRLSDDFEQKVYGKNATQKAVRSKHVGVIAQEVLEVLPEIVHQSGGENGFLSVAYEEIVPLLVEAVKELDVSFGNTSSPEFCDCELEEQIAHATRLVDQLESESKLLHELLLGYTLKKRM